MALELNKMNQTVEDAVKELVTIFMQKSQTACTVSDDQGVTETACKQNVNLNNTSMWCNVTSEHYWLLN